MKIIPITLAGSMALVAMQYPGGKVLVHDFSDGKVQLHTETRLAPDLFDRETRLKRSFLLYDLALTSTATDILPSLK